MAVETKRLLTTSKAISEGIAQEMERDPSVFVMGEDIGIYGGIFGATEGLLAKFGPERVMDTPISETAFIGAATGAALAGMRPIAELMFVDFFGVCMDQIYNHMAKIHYESGGNLNVPVVITTAMGGGYSDGAQHSQTLYGMFAHLPGMKIVVPSTPYDAKGLMISAIRDDNPVLYMFHKGIMGLGWMTPNPRATGPVPEEPYTIPIGKADVKREGRDVTIVTLSLMVHRALDAAEDLAKDGIEAEVLDLRSVVPLDREAIVASVTQDPPAPRRRRGLPELRPVRRGHHDRDRGGVRPPRRAAGPARLPGRADPLQPTARAVLPARPDQDRSRRPPAHGLTGATRGAGRLRRPAPREPPRRRLRMRREIEMPRLSEAVEEGVLVTWLVEPGATVREGDLIAEVQVEKASAEVRAPVAGRIGGCSSGRATSSPGGADRRARDVKASRAAAPAEGRGPAAIDAGTADAEPRPREIVASPVGEAAGPRARGRPAVDRGIRTRGPDRRGGRPGATAPRRPRRDCAGGGTCARRRARAAVRDAPDHRRTTAVGPRLDGAAHPHRGGGRHGARASLAAWSADPGRRTTYTEAIVRACALALRDHPRVAASWTERGLVRAERIDIGVAVALDEGLIVPVVRDADRKDLATLGREIADLAERARSGTLAPADTEGACFSVTNLGAYRIDAFTPLLNPPQTAILGVGRARPRPAVVDGVVVPRTLVVLSLTFDHQVVDGAPAAAFLGGIVGLLEAPDSLFGAGT